MSVRRGQTPLTLVTSVEGSNTNNWQKWHAKRDGVETITEAHLFSYTTYHHFGYMMQPA
jgi:hypothetical protein